MNLRELMEIKLRQLPGLMLLSNLVYHRLTIIIYILSILLQFIYFIVFVYFVDSFIQKTKKLYLDTRAQRNIAKLNDELYEVHQIMTRNVQEVLGVGEKLDRKQSFLRFNSFQWLTMILYSVFVYIDTITYLNS